jgi:alanine racemase
LPADPRRPAWAEVDLTAIAHNVGELRRVSAPAAVWAVVKSNGYGHGSVEVAKAALEAGAAGLCVALVGEAAELRAEGIDAPILLLSEPPVESVGEAVALGLRLTVYRTATARAMSEAGGGRLHVKVDTGMHRVGVAPHDLASLLSEIGALPDVQLEGLWTHFAMADAPDDPFTAEQISIFDTATRDVSVPLVHLANSAAALTVPNAHRSLVRCGIAMYGIAPSAAVAGRASVELRPALSLKARVSMVRRLEEASGVSYGRRRPLPAGTVVATVPIGYGDGVARRWFDVAGEVLIGGRRRALAGVVTMDQLLVDCDDDQTVAVDDEVVLIGKQADAEISAVEWAERLGTIAYEITCAISARVPRAYVR